MAAAASDAALFCANLLRASGLACPCLQQQWQQLADRSALLLDERTNDVCATSISAAATAVVAKARPATFSGRAALLFLSTCFDSGKGREDFVIVSGSLRTSNARCQQWIVVLIMVSFSCYWNSYYRRNTYAYVPTRTVNDDISASYRTSKSPYRTRRNENGRFESKEDMLMNIYLFTRKLTPFY